MVEMDQYAVPSADHAGIEALSPLAHTGLQARNAAGSRPPVSTVSLEEAPVTGLLVIRARDDQDSLGSALSSVVQLDLPQRLSSHQSEDARYCIRWMSPDEWLLSCPLMEAFDLEQRLRESIDGSIAIVNVSGGYGLLTLTGADALSLLKKSTAYDVHPVNFCEGKVVNTMLAKAQVTLRVVAAERYEILVRRSLADYLWLWLQRAGSEFGLRAFSADD